MWIDSNSHLMWHAEPEAIPPSAQTVTDIFPLSDGFHINWTKSICIILWTFVQSLKQCQLLSFSIRHPSDPLFLLLQVSARYARSQEMILRYRTAFLHSFIEMYQMN